MFLFAGLGNPGHRYDKNRHNIGFNFLDHCYPNISYKNKFKGLFAENMNKKEKLFLLKPMTFMNLSGEAILEIKNFFKIDNDNIFIIHDDLDLSVGKIKIKNGGSNGGHNGLESISDKIGNEYNRIRIGIGHPGDKNLVESYVLSNFKKDEYNMIKNCFLNIQKNLELIFSKDFDEFSSKVNNTL
jgi:peptidyl-tRNA hydrolase, PTH1 family